MPGYVQSSDGDVHYIGVADLVKLYHVRKEEVCTSPRGCFDSNCIRLTPRNDGNYNLHDAIIRQVDDRIKAQHLEGYIKHPTTVKDKLLLIFSKQFWSN